MSNDSMAITNYVFMTSGVADAIVEGLDEKLSETVFEEYVMSREAVTAIRETMYATNQLMKKFFEQNQAFLDAMHKAKEETETP